MYTKVWLMLLLDSGICTGCRQMWAVIARPVVTHQHKGVTMYAKVWLVLLLDSGICTGCARCGLWQLLVGCSGCRG